MRPRHLLGHYLTRDHLCLCPLLGYFGAVDATLDAVALMLRAREPRACHPPANDVGAAGLELRRARNVMALTIALQTAIHDYAALLVERADMDLGKL